MGVGDYSAGDASEQQLLESPETPGPNYDQFNVLLRSVIDYCLDDRGDGFRVLSLDMNALFLSFRPSLAHDTYSNFSCVCVVIIDLMRRSIGHAHYGLGRQC